VAAATSRWTITELWLRDGVIDVALSASLVVTATPHT
jgi:hypothetical protein